MFFLADISELLSRTWAFVTTGRVLAIVFGVLFACVAVAAIIASRTKWGQSKPLTKFIVISVLAHVWLVIYAVSTPLVLPQGNYKGRDKGVSMRLEALVDTPLEDPATVPEPIADSQEVREAWDEPIALENLPIPTTLAKLTQSELTAPALLQSPEPSPLPALPPPPSVATAADEFAESMPREADSRSAEPTTPPLPEPKPAPEPLDESAVAKLMVATEELPPEYRLRQARNRLEIAEAFGADADSEAAVQGALTWLARAQSADGSWDASAHGAGTETYTLGEYRHSTGSKADTGITGLALLAFLSAGETHQHGDHQACVANGLRYLIRAQMPSGDLSGPEQTGSEPSVVYARMYCHSIATLALAEALVMSGDSALVEPVSKAAKYSINAQDKRGGGWRYRPYDSGDLSQFGWVAMGLHSAERSGLKIPVDTKARMNFFLESCSTGKFGGLARYRPNEGRPSETMTAEALACRLLLQQPLTSAAQDEALQMIMAKRPGVGEDNVYFWYYATLGLFQLQDDNWRLWNHALKQRLIASQVPRYQADGGSWQPDPMWGGYGGRVYSTAVSCMCLEVYYRYLPMYQQAKIAQYVEPELTPR